LVSIFPVFLPFLPIHSAGILHLIFSMNVLETVSKDLTQIPKTVRLSLEYVPSLPTAKKKFGTPYWVDWTEQLGAWVSGDGSDVKILIRDDARDIDVGELTLGFTSVLTGVCLNLQGQVAIHANAVSLEGLGIAFVGYSGRGKSTLSAYCASRGAGFITDDVLVINEHSHVVSGNPRIKLYPEVGEILGLDASEETDYKIFYEPGQLGALLHRQPVPLGIIYLLDESPDERIYAERLPQSQAAYDLLTHGYDVSLFIPTNPNLLNAYARLVKQTPVKKLFYPRDFAMLPQVYDFLLKEVHQL
jgi:hypothetical protein